TRADMALAVLLAAAFALGQTAGHADLPQGPLLGGPGATLAAPHAVAVLAAPAWTTPHPGQGAATRTSGLPPGSRSEPAQNHKPGPASSCKGSSWLSVGLSSHSNEPGKGRRRLWRKRPEERQGDNEEGVASVAFGVAGGRDELDQDRPTGRWVPLLQGIEVA